jgi:hypothetical protein
MTGIGTEGPERILKEASEFGKMIYGLLSKLSESSSLAAGP